jgi:hypothetical protein
VVSLFADELDYKLCFLFCLILIRNHTNFRPFICLISQYLASKFGLILFKNLVSFFHRFHNSRPVNSAYFIEIACVVFSCISCSRFPLNCPLKNAVYFLYAPPSPQFGLKSGYSQHVGLSQLYVT